MWEAPEDGYYTWRLKDTGEVVPTYSKLRVTVFTGSSIEDMQLVAESGRTPYRPISCCGRLEGNDIGSRPAFRQVISRRIPSARPPPE